MENCVVDFFPSQKNQARTHLVVLLHGYGSHEQDLMGLVNHLTQEGITYASVRAPQPVGYALPADAESAFVGSPALGYQWWPLNQQLETVGFRAIELAVDYVLDWLEPLAADYRSVNLLGFSQGMAIATSIARHRPDLVRTVIGLSGYAVDGGESYFKDAELTAAPLPLFWGRDDADPVITAEKISFTQEWVKNHTALTDYLYAGIGHGVAASELAHMSAFIRENILN